MKIKIHLLSSALFWGYPQILDLDTGQIYTSPLQDEKIKQLKRSRLLPHYSEAKIYQDYLQIIHDRFGVPLEDWFYQYPKFEFDLDSVYMNSSQSRTPNCNAANLHSGKRVDFASSHIRSASA